jgi:hypothetical protein
MRAFLLWCLRAVFFAACIKYVSDGAMVRETTITITTTTVTIPITQRSTAVLNKNSHADYYLYLELAVSHD